MIASLTTGVSGLRAHQQMLEIVGNNLANVNTPAFKASRVTFSEALSETLRPAMGPSGSQGGVNPIQRGFGVKVASVDVDNRQGTLETTGRGLDLAIQGEGYFVADDGTQDVYTRVGTFTIDSDGKLVHSARGYRVIDRNGEPVTIPQNTRLAGRPTETIYVTGNLDASALPPSTEVQTSRQPFRMGGVAATADTPLINPITNVDTTSAPFTASSNPARATTVLNNLDGVATPYADGDGIDITGTDVNGDDVAASYTISDAGAATLGGLRDAISAAFGGATCTIDASGNLVLTADAASASSLALTLADHAGNTGALAWASHAFTETAAGQDGLEGLTTPYSPDDRIAITGTDADGTAVSAAFVYGSGPGQDGTTLGALRDKITASFAGATCSIDDSGNLLLTATQEGPSGLSLSLADVGVTEHMDWLTHVPFNETTPGSRGTTWESTITIFDSQGLTHILTLTFEKKGSNTWDLTASIPSDQGTMTDTKIEGVKFSEDGSFAQTTGVGEGDPGISVTFPGLGEEEISIDFGSPGGFSGLTQFGGRFSAAPTRQDGYEAGSLSGLSVREDGVIQGTFTNGQVSDIATLQVATFSNPSGLRTLGDGFLSRTSNSGLPQPGQAGLSGAGNIISGALESSGVDVAYEFTRLIVAQRGFQVNARTIGVTDQVLEELANLIR